MPGQNVDVSAATTPGGAGGFRGRVEQQVDAITGSANRVLSGVVDSGFGVLRSLLPVAGSADGNVATVVEGEDGLAVSAPWNVSRPGFGLLRRESGFSIASLAASLPGAAMRDRARSFASAHSAATGLEEEGQEMVESRPGSVKGLVLREEEDDDDDEVGEESESGESEGEGEEEGEEEARHDARSIRSFESMMSGRSRSNRRRQVATQSSLKPDKPKKERLSITDRLASMSRLTKGGNTPHSHSQEPSRQSVQHVSVCRYLVLCHRLIHLSSLNFHEDFTRPYIESQHWLLWTTRFDAIRYAPLLPCVIARALATTSNASHITNAYSAFPRVQCR